MAITETRMIHRSFDQPDETRAAGSGKAEVIGAGDLAMMRITLPPGWRWANDVQPLAQTPSCEAPHFQYHVAGRLHVLMDDGSEDEFVAGDLSILPPGHDAWVVGDEACVVIDVTGAQVWAKPS